jgi:hypothetical protein
MWNPIASAPRDKDLELAVVDDEGYHALIFPCRRREGHWIDSRTGAVVPVRPSHWRDWDSAAAEAAARQQGVGEAPSGEATRT